MSTRFQRALVIGASSGIGKAIAEQLAASGCQVACVARRPGPDGANLTHYAHDVTDFAQTGALFQRICHDLGGLDVVFYASGVMPAVASEEFDFDKDKSMVDVNVLGAIAWLNEAAVRFSAEGRGTIVGIGSVAGDRGRAPKPVYGATKAFLDTYLESLRNRLGTKGVRVVTIKPGPTDTPMAADHVGKKLPVAEAARQILLAAQKGKRVAYVPGLLRFVFAIIKALPSPVMQRLKF
jgi:NAD(P)-dependent dehydrogenase (short-subunit alcohol dehydrogenase family)